MTSMLRLAIDMARGRLHPRDAVGAAVPPVARREPSPGPRHDPSAPRLLLSPHFDDAVLSCWTELSADAHVVVANVFAGHPRADACSLYDRIAGATDAGRRMQERAAEDREALSLAGRVAVNLDFVENEYRRRAPAVSHLLRALAGKCPAASTVVAPAAIGLHPDHVLVRNAALVLARTGMPVELYADMPYCASYGWPAWVTGRPQPPNLVVDAYWEPALRPLGRRGLTLTGMPRTLSPEQRTSKLAAMRRYVTQYPTLTRGPLDVLAHPDVHGYEVKWCVDRESRRTR